MSNVKTMPTRVALKNRLKEHIKSEMKAKKIKQIELAYHVGTHQSHISRMLSPNDQSASIEFLITCLLHVGGVCIAKIGGEYDEDKLRYKAVDGDHTV